MKDLRLLWLGFVLLLAACSSSGSDASDNARNHSFYGGASAGWTHLQPQ